MFTSILRTPAKDGQEWKCRGRISRPPISYKIEGYTEDGTFELIGEGFFNEEWLCTAPPPERNPEGTVINSTFAFGDPNLSYGFALFFGNSKMYSRYRVTFPNLRSDIKNYPLSIAELELPVMLLLIHRRHLPRLRRPLRRPLDQSQSVL
jgi:hypothetical protein